MSMYTQVRRTRTTGTWNSLSVGIYKDTRMIGINQQCEREYNNNNMLFAASKLFCSILYLAYSTAGNSKYTRYSTPRNDPHQPCKSYRTVVRPARAPPRRALARVSHGASRSVDCGRADSHPGVGSGALAA